MYVRSICMQIFIFIVQNIGKPHIIVLHFWNCKTRWDNIAKDSKTIKEYLPYGGF